MARTTFLDPSDGPDDFGIHGAEARFGLRPGSFGQAFDQPVWAEGDSAFRKLEIRYLQEIWERPLP